MLCNRDCIICGSVGAVCELEWHQGVWDGGVDVSHDKPFKTFQGYSLPDAAVLSCRCIKKTVKFPRNIGYYSSSGRIGGIVSNRANPVCSPVIVHSPREQRVEAKDLLAAVVSSGYPHIGLYIGVVFLFRVSGIRAWSGVSSMSYATDSLK